MHWTYRFPTHWTPTRGTRGRRVANSLLVWWNYKFISSLMCLLLFTFQSFSNSCSIYLFFRIYRHNQSERQGRVCLNHFTRNVKPRPFPFYVIINMFRMQLIILLFIICFASQILFLCSFFAFWIMWMYFSISLYLLTFWLYLFVLFIVPAPGIKIYTSKLSAYLELIWYHSK